MAGTLNWPSKMHIPHPYCRVAAKDYITQPPFHLGGGL